MSFLGAKLWVHSRHPGLFLVVPGAEGFFSPPRGTETAFHFPPTPPDSVQYPQSLWSERTLCAITLNGMILSPHLFVSTSSSPCSFLSARPSGCLCANTWRLLTITWEDQGMHVSLDVVNGCFKIKAALKEGSVGTDKHPGIMASFVDFCTDCSSH